MTSGAVYLDNNATTAIDPRVLAVMEECWRTAFANPGSAHAFGRASRRVLEDSRESICAILDAEPDELVFSSCVTESVNTAVYGLTRGRRGVMALTDGEHPAVRESCRHAALDGWSTISIPVDSSGRIAQDRLSSLPWHDIRLTCLILAHNETGVIQDTASLANHCRSLGIPLVLDAVQAIGKIPVSFRASQATAMAFAAHKFHGPRGVGGLLVRRGLRMPSLLHGGHQEHGRRAGTEAVPLIAGMARALELWHSEMTERQQRVQALRDYLQQGLRAQCAPVMIHGAQAPRLPNTLSIAFPGVPGEALLVSLHLAGIACSLGSTCASGSAEPAPSLLAMGVPAEICRSSVRFSLSHLNTMQELDTAMVQISQIVKKLRKEDAP
ncbi:MAG: cysteine desulfurase family protein [Planctomycetia bacterium]